MALLSTVIQAGTRAAQPSPGTALPDAPAGTLYVVTDEGYILERSNGVTWQAVNTTAIIASALSLSSGGTGVALADPGQDRILFWDDSAGQVAWLGMGTTMSITITSLNSVGGAPGGAANTVQFNSGATFGGFGTTDGQAMRLTPSNPGLGGDSTFRFGLHVDSTFDAINIVDPVFANLDSAAFELVNLNGQNQYAQGTNAKLSFLVQQNNLTSYAAGQRQCNAQSLLAFGMGDAHVTSAQLNVMGGIAANGDEGAGFASDNLQHYPSQVSASVTAVATAATISTTISQDVVASRSAQAVLVASTAGVIAGQWVVVDGASGFGGNADPVKVTAVGASAISGVFRSNHSNGATVKPATVVVIDSPYGFGQGLPLINLSAISYSTGTTTPTASSQVVVGSGTTWTASMVGGDAANPGYIAFTPDTIADLSSYGGTGSMRSWFPITAINTTSNLSISRLDVLGQAGYPANGLAGAGSAYTIRPGAVILAFDDDYFHLVLDTNTFAWTIGDSVEAAHSVNNEWSGIVMRFNPLLPGRYDYGLLLRASGEFQCNTGITIDVTGNGGWATGIAMNGVGTAMEVACTSAALSSLTDTYKAGDILFYQNGGTQVSMGQNTYYGGGNSLVLSANPSYRAPETATETRDSVLSLAFGSPGTMRWNGNTSLVGSLTTNSNGATLGLTTVSALRALGVATAQSVNVQTDGASADLLLDSYGAISHTYMRRADGTVASPTAVQADDQIGQFRADGYDGTDFGFSSLIAFFASENFTGSARGGYMRFYTVTTGTTTLATRIQVDDAGLTVASGGIYKAGSASGITFSGSIGVGSVITVTSGIVTSIT